MVLPIAKLKDPDRVDEPEIGAKGIGSLTTTGPDPEISLKLTEVKEALAEAISDLPSARSSS